MARGRMISKTLGTASKKFQRLRSDYPDVGLFAQALFPLLITHTDDYGRLQGDSFTVKHSVWSTAPDDESVFEAGLSALHDVDLISRYHVDDVEYLQVVNFEEHQQGLHKRTASKIPSPADGVLDASEKVIEERLADALLDGSVRFDGHVITDVKRQVRKDNSYIDIVATSDAGREFVIEVKRQRITTKAIAQVKGYMRHFTEAAIPVVVGHGLATGLSHAPGCLLATYDDQLQFTTPTPLNDGGVRHLTLATVDFVPGQEKRRELKGREPNSKEEPAYVPSVVPIASVKSSVHHYRKREDFVQDQSEELIMRAGDLVQNYYEWFVKERRGARLLRSDALDFQKAYPLVETWDDARLEKLARIVLTTDDDWVSGTDRSFKIFAAKATWADDRLTQWETEQRAKGVAV